MKTKLLGFLPLLGATLAVAVSVLPRLGDLADPGATLAWAAALGILAIGAVFPIAVGGIDLSIGSIVGLIGTLLPVLLLECGYGLLPSLVLLFGVCTTIGLFHGWLVSRVRIQAFLVTLFGLVFYRGLARSIGGNEAIRFDSSASVELRRWFESAPVSLSLAFASLGLLLVLAGALGGGPRGGRKRWFAHRYEAKVQFIAGLMLFLIGSCFWLVNPMGYGRVMAPMPLLALIVAGSVAWIVLNFSVFGRHLTAVGHDRRAAYFSGITTSPLVLAAYVIGALYTGVAALMFTIPRAVIVPASHGSSLELYALAAAALGGCRLRGGFVSVPGTILGAACLAIVHEASDLFRTPPEIQLPIVAGVLLVAVATDQVLARTLSRRRATRVGAGIEL